MLRVVSSSGNGVGGSADPILNSTVPYHTHTFTTSTETAAHSHGDFGHSHTMTFNRTSKSGNATAYMVTDPTYGENLNGSATYGTSTGNANLANENALHQHTGGTDSNSNQGNWAPRYIDMIICSKN